MITSAETLQRLDMVAATTAAPCQLGGDMLKGVVADLKALRAYEAAAARLGGERDDSTPANDEAEPVRGAPFDEALLPTENL